MVVAILGHRPGHRLAGAGGGGLLAFDVSDLFLERVAQLIRGALQLRHSLAQRACDLRQLLRPKQQEADEQQEPDFQESAAEQMKPPTDDRRRPRACQGLSVPTRSGAAVRATHLTPACYAGMKPGSSGGRAQPVSPSSRRLSWIDYDARAGIPSRTPAPAR